MTFKKLVQAFIVVCGIFTISACSTTGSHNSDGKSGAAGASGVQTAGLGQDSDSFGGRDGSGAQLAGKHTYYFDYDKSDIHQDDMPAIYANANYLRAHPHATITLDGHTDPRGSREYNIALGERRANAIAEVLKSKGVNAEQIRVVSYGAQRLAMPGHTEQDYQMDRRAVIASVQG